MSALEYHERTKHAFNRFARSPGRLDWATQPDPFRHYTGAPWQPLPRAPLRVPVSYPSLFDGSAEPQPIGEHAIGEFLRTSLGLSAWKAYQQTRWPLRVNPSSGNLHPTEGYLVWRGRVCHYTPREHGLEERCRFSDGDWQAFTGGADGFLFALTSISWREAWKYGERAFRYCQHDTGHALGAARLAAARLGWHVRILPRWADTATASLLGTDRAPSDPRAEREEVECLMVVTPGRPEPWMAADPGLLLRAVNPAEWHGEPNVLSAGHVEWPIIQEVEAVTRYGGGQRREAVTVAQPPASQPGSDPLPAGADARAIILGRRSAVAFDGRSSLPLARFERMFARLLGGNCPWDLLGTPPLVHLVLFVHRVEGLTPGVYALTRDAAAARAWRQSMRPEFLWEPYGGAALREYLWLLLPADVAWSATRVSCDQDIAGDGYFSLGMLAPVRTTVQDCGPWAYRRLFWECGLVGQVLYLEAEAAGGRSTGIGCFYDDAVHEWLGLTGGDWQSLYHFSMGVPVDDGRLTTEPGYEWETSGGA